MNKEFSAGGIVIKDNKILLILMKTLNSKKVWTYPKGHIEKDEKVHKAALREVLEETGYKCKIKKEKPIYISEYFFIRNNKNVKKTVHWFLMEVIEESIGIQTLEEIEKFEWFDLNNAEKKLIYKSDVEILNLIKNL